MPVKPENAVPDIAALKAAIRIEALARRSLCDPGAGVALADLVLRELAFPRRASISGVWPLEGEMDLRPLMTALHERGHTILLPQTTPLGNPLIFREWTPGAPMIRERFGTERPDGPVGVPDVVFVPLLAFDRKGNRLGYGGGYYDRTLATLPGCNAIGFGFAAQEVDGLPTEPHDFPLQAIVTEEAIIRFPSALNERLNKVP